MRRHPDLVAVSLASVAAAALILAVPVPAIQLALALPLCLVAPGYAIVEAAFARHALSGVLRVLLVATMSISVLVLGALVLNELRDGIRDATWAAGLAGVVVACCAVAGARRVTPGRPLRPPAVRAPRLADAVLVMVAVALVATAVLVSRTTTEARVVGYTQLWMLPTGDPEARQLDVGIRSAELREQGYRLEVQYGREQQRRLVVPGIRLAPGDEYHRIVTLPANDEPVTALLFRAGEDRVYRRADTGQRRR